MLDGLITELMPPTKRQEKCEGLQEKHFTEAAVMLAFADHLLNTIPGVSHVEIHPDGEHVKRFDVRKWLENHDFKQSKTIGTTTYSGSYQRENQTITVTSKPGIGDVVTDDGTNKIVAECKGGIINTKHPGQVSRLRRGLCEAIGLLMQRPGGERQIAVVPNTKSTLQLAQKMIARTSLIGIEIALVDEKGNVSFVKP
jgi:hypothetical protein